MGRRAGLLGAPIAAGFWKLLVLAPCGELLVRSMTSGRLPWTLADIVGAAGVVRGCGEVWKVPERARFVSGGGAAAEEVDLGASAGLLAESCRRLCGAVTGTVEEATEPVICGADVVEGIKVRGGGRLCRPGPAAAACNLSFGLFGGP